MIILVVLFLIIAMYLLNLVGCGFICARQKRKMVNQTEYVKQVTKQGGIKGYGTAHG